MFREQEGKREKTANLNTDAENSATHIYDALVYTLETLVPQIKKISDTKREESGRGALYRLTHIFC